MKRIVFDTNVLVSAALRQHSTPALVFTFAVRQCQLLVSLPTLSELRMVLERPKFDRFVAFGQRRRFYDALASVSVIIPINRTITLCRDPNDNKFLELAASGAADFLVTGDSDLLTLHPFEDIDILTPAQFSITVMNKQ
jgi:putative PIN family toxin of toxin-antitoxin system